MKAAPNFDFAVAIGTTTVDVPMAEEFDHNPCSTFSASEGVLRKMTSLATFLKFQVRFSIIQQLDFANSGLVCFQCRLFIP